MFTLLRANYSRFTIHDSLLFFPPFGNLFAVEVALDGDALDVGARGGAVLVVERVLRGGDVAGELRDDAREGVARAVQVKAFDAGRARVLLQVLHEAPGGQCLAGPPA